MSGICKSKTKILINDPAQVKSIVSKIFKLFVNGMISIENFRSQKKRFDVMCKFEPFLDGYRVASSCGCRILAGLFTEGFLTELYIRDIVSAKSSFMRLLKIRDTSFSRIFHQ